MKILLVGSFNLADGYKGGYEAMERLGVEMSFLPGHRVFNDIKDKLINDKVNKFLATALTNEKMTDVMLSGIDEHKPDYVLLWRGEVLSTIALRAIKSKGVGIIYYSWDDPYQITEASCEQIKNFSPYCDYVFTCADNVVDTYKAYGAKEVHWVIPGFDPEIHKPFVNPTDDDIKKYSCDVSFVATNCYKGNHFTKHFHFDRSEMINTIKDMDIDIHLYGTGEDVPGWLNPQFGGGEEFRSMYKGWCPFEDSHKVFSLSKINLNSHIRPDGSKYLNERCGQVMGSGGFLLVDNTANLNDVYEVGKELESYSSYAELRDKNKFYLENEDKRKEIARRGYEKATTMYTWDNWAKFILDKIGG